MTTNILNNIIIIGKYIIFMYFEERPKNSGII